MNLLLCFVLLLATAAAPEATDVEALARGLRIQTYETFRQDRAEFERRRQEGERVLAAWRSAGERAEDLPQLTDWFQRATRVSQSGSIGPLPAMPHFGPDEPRVSSPVSDDTNRPAATQSSEPPRQSTPPAQESSAPLPRATVPVPDFTLEPAPVPVDVAPAPARNRPQTTPRADADGDRAQINIVELDARSAGFNRGVQTLEIALDDKRPRTAGELSLLIDELADSRGAVGTLSLYHDHVLSPLERTSLPSLTALTDVAAALGNRIFAARQAAQQADLSDVARQAELDHLDELSQRLAKVIASP